jgi:sugar lactone lactonase YvrE
VVNARNMEVLRVSEDRAAHGEGPIWDARTQNLHWVDMLAGDLLSLRVSDGFVHRRHVATVLAVLRPRRMGGFVMALERGFAILDDRSATPHYLGDLWTDISVRTNDGGCDPQGRFYAGSMAYDQTPGRGTLYRLELDESVTVVLNDVTISNGLVWSADAETVYYIDSATQRVDAFDFDAGAGTFFEPPSLRLDRSNRRLSRQDDHRRRRRPVGCAVGRRRRSPLHRERQAR